MGKREIEKILKQEAEFKKTLGAYKDCKGYWVYQLRDSENTEYRCSRCWFPVGVKTHRCPHCLALMED